MRAVIDTCVIIDALQDREPFAQDAEQIILACANRRCMGLVTAKAVTDSAEAASRPMARSRGANLE